jgi:hypothetical protein
VWSFRRHFHQHICGKRYDLTAGFQNTCPIKDVKINVGMGNMFFCTCPGSSDKCSNCAESLMRRARTLMECGFGISVVSKVLTIFIYIPFLDCLI